jgi:hypothetical protein
VRTRRNYQLRDHDIIKDILRHRSYGRIELICCNRLEIQSVASIALVVNLPLCLYKEA